MNCQVSALTDSELESLLTSPRFRSFGPVTCQGCGDTGPFVRRIFRIVGVPRSKWADDEVQGLLSTHFRTAFGIESVFFRHHGDDFFADSAVCRDCGSSQIVFDIELTDEILSRFAAMSGRGLTEVRSEIEGLAEKISRSQGSQRRSPHRKSDRG